MDKYNININNKNITAMNVDILIDKLAKHLNWGQMKASIAIPAIEKIISEFCYCVAEVCQAEISPEEGDSMLQWNPDEVFFLLLGDGMQEHTPPVEKGLFISLRREIEYEMIVHHMPYREAIQEWYK